MPENRLYSDAAHRCSDIITEAALAGFTGWWIAIRMSDGGWDKSLYETRRVAIEHQFYEQFCCYVCVPPGGMTPKEAQNFLDYNRNLYDAGFRMPDPEIEVPLMPLLKKDQQRQINALTKKRN
jgi:hypothetical protein